MDEGKGKVIRDYIANSMIENLGYCRYHPGGEMKAIRYPNTMYYIPNWIFAIAIQLCCPVIIIGALFTLGITVYDTSAFTTLSNVFYLLRVY